MIFTNKYLYRAHFFGESIPNEDDILCKNPDSGANIVQFILQGSKAVKSKFLSMTNTLGIADKVFSMGINPEKQETRNPIVLVDTEKLKSCGIKYHDCCGDWDGVCQREGINVNTDSKQAGKVAFASQEIIAEKSIPKEAYKVIPPVLVDLLDAFENWNSIINKENEILNAMHPNEIKKKPDNIADRGGYIETIQKMIMEDGGTTLVKEIEKIKGFKRFNEIEDCVYENYYDNMLNCTTIANIFEKRFCNDKYVINKEDNKTWYKSAVMGVKANLVKMMLNNGYVQDVINTARENNGIDIYENPIEMNIDDVIKKYFIPMEGSIKQTSKEDEGANRFSYAFPRNTMRIAIEGHPYTTKTVLLKRTYNSPSLETKNNIWYMPVGVEYEENEFMIKYFSVSKTFNTGEKAVLSTREMYEKLGDKGPGKGPNSTKKVEKADI